VYVTSISKNNPNLLLLLDIIHDPFNAKMTMRRFSDKMVQLSFRVNDHE